MTGVFNFCERRAVELNWIQAKNKYKGMTLQQGFKEIQGMKMDISYATEIIMER